MQIWCGGVELHIMAGSLPSSNEAPIISPALAQLCSLFAVNIECVASHTQSAAIASFLTCLCGCGYGARAHSGGNAFTLFERCARVCASVNLRPRSNTERAARVRDIINLLSNRVRFITWCFPVVCRIIRADLLIMESVRDASLTA
jgi:hypothetical protein